MGERSSEDFRFNQGPVLKPASRPSMWLIFTGNMKGFLPNMDAYNEWGKVLKDAIPFKTGLCTGSFHAERGMRALATQNEGALSEVRCAVQARARTREQGG